MTKTRDLANLIADSKVGPSEIDTAGNYEVNQLGIGSALEGGYGSLQLRGSFAYVNEDGSDTKQLYIRSDFGSNGPAIQVATAHPLRFVTNNNWRAEIQSTGDLNLNSGVAFRMNGTTVIDSNRNIDGGQGTFIVDDNTEYSDTEDSELNPVGSDALYLYNDESTSTYGKVSLHMRSRGSGGAASSRITLKNNRGGSSELAFFLRDNGHTGEQRNKFIFNSDGHFYLKQNGGFIRGFDTSGDGTRLLGINTDDAIYMGDVDGVTTGSLRLRGPGAATQLALGSSTISASGGHLFVEGDNGQYGLYIGRYAQTNESAFLNTDDGKLQITMRQDEANYGGVQINLDVTAANSTGTSAGQFSVYNDDAEKVFAIDAKGYGVISSSTSSGAYLSLQNLDTTLEADQTIGAVYFNANDGSEDGSETQAYVKAVAADTSPDTRLEFGVLRNQGGVDDTVGTEMILYQTGQLWVGNHTQIDGDLTLKGGTNQHAALRFQRSDVNTYDFAYIGFNDLTQANDDFVISAAGNGNAIKLITNGDRISFSTDNNTTAETFVNSNGAEIHAPRFYTRQNNSVSYTSASSTSNYRIYPQHYDTYSGAGTFFFRTSPINTDSTPRFNVRFGGTPQEVAGKIFLSTNDRTNSPSNAQFRHMWKEYAIGFYSEGDNDGSAGRFITELNSAASNYVTGYGVDYVSTNHAQYNTNSDPWHNSYGYYYWDLTSWQGHPLVVKIDLWRGANYTWYYWWS